MSDEELDAVKIAACEAHLEDLSQKHPEPAVFLKKMKPFVELFGSSLSRRRERPLDWDALEPVTADHMVPLSKVEEEYETRQPTDEEIGQLLSRVAVLKLNGGLGTTMGMLQPKCLVEVQDGKSFFDLHVQHIKYYNEKYNVDIPLVLMNSFYTEDAMQEFLREAREQGVTVLTFMQKKNPKILEETYLPLPTDFESLDEWNPPGHGDVYDSLIRTGMRQRLIDLGKKILILANVDNLGATVSVPILDYFVQHDLHFFLEVTPKTLADVKGGTLVRYRGRTKLLELAMVPSEHVAEFCSVDRFKVFNTNTMWIAIGEIPIQLTELKRCDIIFNKKVVAGRKVVQLETACGSAVEWFARSAGIEVPRSRFRPVKKCQDLFCLQSPYLFETTPDGSIRQLEGKTRPHVVFEGPYLNMTKEYFRRFEDKPDISNLRSLYLSGDVWFGRGIVIQGDVSISVPEGETLRIPDGTILGSL